MAEDTQFFVGTSGFSYDEWRPAFYPQGLKKTEMLSYYASRLPAVELNNTFYRMPSEKSVTTWAGQVSDDFRFAVKAPRFLTWSKRMQDCEEAVQELFMSLSHLRHKLGCVFYQVPKFVHMDLRVLEAFLKIQPVEKRIGLDFMHESWATPEVLELMHSHGATVVSNDLDDEASPKLSPGAPWLYLRLRRVAYGDDELCDWRNRIRQAGVEDAFVFFKHESSCAGPALARRFLEL